ncbi:MAG: hypothetical protein KF690_06085 [Bacteroidetes bacterium]|nr:hypothetical protein [Bacteroidota bacterium]
MKKYLLMATTCVVFFACNKKAEDKKAEGNEPEKKEAEAPKVEPVANKKLLLESLKLEGYKKGSIADTDYYSNVYFTDSEKSPEGYAVNVSINVNPCEKLTGGCKTDAETIKKGLGKAEKNEKREVVEIEVGGKKAYLEHIIKFDGTPKGTENWARLVYPNGRFYMSINLKGEGFATTSEAEVAKMDISHFKTVATQLANQIIPQI